MRTRLYYYFAWALVVVGVIVTLAYLLALRQAGWTCFGDGKLDVEKTGQVGDYIGGFVGSLFSLAGFIFLYLTLREQRNSFQRERFENQFFELVKLYRDNIGDLSYTKFHRGELKTNNTRKVFKVIYGEFQECLQEVRRFNNSKNLDDYYLPRYKKQIQSLYKDNGLSPNLVDVATADIAYCIVFFGIAREGEFILRKILQRKYKADYILHVLNFIKLKPRGEFESEYRRWEKLKSLSYVELRKSLHNIYFVGRPKYDITLSSFEKVVFKNLEIEKYYGGHQHRLGHYFRHLFQTFKFINLNTKLAWDDKYFYGKTLRAQLSTYEQGLLFVNSISSLGMKWQLNPDIRNKGTLSIKKKQEAKEASRLISQFNIIKNLPGEHIYGLYFKDFYPDVDYESDEIVHFGS